MNPTNTTPPKILYVDDDQDDCVLLKESFSDTGNTNMVLASNGDEAIEYLDSNESLPSLIILDLNMPRRDGRQTMQYIKSKPRLSGIPVVILSTSKNQADKEVCSRLGAVSYLEKPDHYSGYKEIVSNCLPFISS